ncbi:hypothetical protein RvY_16411-2 [Ramazzottius varieornatus]|uniref:FAD-binding FR-type domain-containing protein n=1 Tax=Ramazzottius varieornatus TaxID=947166 RepID=A0A1D1VYC7_RAMVA|nr:hypothetical protein RvY_16411-2 [Ramazzottius varieornatus]
MTLSMSCFLPSGCFQLSNAGTGPDEMAENTTSLVLTADGWENPAAIALSANAEMISGWLAFLALLVILAGALPFVRRTGRFEIFFYSHLVGYITYFVTVFVHARNSFFWVFASVPGALFLLEKAYNVWRVHLKKSCKVRVRKVVQWPSGVTELTLQRPLTFRFHGGSYVFIKVPVLTDFEWHPFTISSCPEDLGRSYNLSILSPLMLPARVLSLLQTVWSCTFARPETGLAGFTISSTSASPSQLPCPFLPNKATRCRPSGPV